MSSKSSSNDSKKYLTISFWQVNQFWREQVITGFEGGKVIYGESMKYSDKSKDYFDKLLADRMKRTRALTQFKNNSI